MKLIYGYACLLGLALSFVTPASAMTEDEFRTITSKVFAPMMSKHGIPGLAVGVTWHGRQYVYTTGTASRKTSAPVSADTLFELGSVSKTFNVILAALAEQRQLLSLSDATSSHLPELKGSAFDAVSLMDLATHQTNGLPLQVPDAVTNDAALTRWLRAWHPSPVAGQERSYSNVGIGLLGRVSAGAFGQPYARAIRENVLLPFSLDSTYVKVPASEQARYAQGYTRKGNQPVRVNPGMLDAEAYGLKSDVGDMLHFLQIQLGNVTVAEDMRAAIARTHQGQTRAAHFTQAMIWERYPWPVSRDQLLAGNAPQMATTSQPAKRIEQVEAGENRVLFSKTGSTSGFAAYVALVPDEDIGIVLLANRNVSTQVRVDPALTLIETLLATGQ